ncbi:hypothetical protein D9757_014706 [Collybiopsis confluens]|uniref:DUF985 domain-containing protein n=1 Tax=Collybiopsis confluens TaxID=2823264 RepID=A0A8H5FRW2_9AGAR|nr:hypothetical protein D9757_014706 [Collybiopsis confluens]
MVIPARFSLILLIFERKKPTQLLTRIMSWIPTDVLIRELNLQKHPEGDPLGAPGYFIETDRQALQIPSPYSDNQSRPLATSIYYLLTKDSPSGIIHMNKSVTYHVLHQGRAQYTLIYPPSESNPGPPRIERHIMGSNTSAGETRLLLVGTGVWKMSQLLPDLGSESTEPDYGCLITEVVVPGFGWGDHAFLTRDGLIELFRDVEDRKEGDELVRQFEKHVKAGEQKS